MKKIATIVALTGLMVLGGATMAHATDPYNPPGGGHTPVTFCHKPGTPAEQELTTDDDGFLQGHLNHGDTLGACPVVIPPEPEPVVTRGEQSEPVITCEHVVGDEVTVQVTVTVTPWVWNGTEWVPDTANAETGIVGDVYIVTQYDVDAIAEECEPDPEPTPTPTPTEPAPEPEPTETPAPVTPQNVNPEPVAELAETGPKENLLIGTSILGALLVGAGLYAMRKGA
jgi:hypothetical protein